MSRHLKTTALRIPDRTAPALAFIVSARVRYSLPLRPVIKPGSWRPGTDPHALRVR